MNDLSAARPSEILAFGPFRADAFVRTLAHEAQGPIALTPKQFDTLLMLLRHPGEVLDKERLLAEVWAGSVVEENNLSQAISALRKALGDDGETHRYILTVPRKGYRFVAEVRLAEAVRLAEPPAAPVQEGAALRQVPVMASTLENSAASVVSAAPVPHASTRRSLPWYWLAVICGMAAAIGAAWWLLRPAPTSAPAAAERSVAVLPFTNLSNAQEDAFFGAGMTEDMVTQLSQVSGLKVVSHRFAGEKPVTADRALAQKLGAAHFLLGTVRRAGERLRISAQLIDAETGRHLWAKSFDRPVEDVLKVQSEVAAEIAGALAAVLQPAERQALGAYAQSNALVQLKYREGRYLVARGRHNTEADRQRGVAVFEQLIKEHRESPLGHIGLATFHMLAPNLRIASAEESFRRAEAHVDAALRIDPRSAEAHGLKAEIEGRARWNWRAAAESGERAVTLNPALPEAWARYAMFGLWPFGRMDDAERALRRAIALEPYNAEVAHALALLLALTERCGEAIAQARANLEKNPAFLLNLVPMHRCHDLRGDHGKAIELLRQANFSWTPPEAADDMAAAFAREGAPGYWRAHLKWARRWDAKDANGTYYLAAYLAQTGAIDEAFRELDRAIGKRDLYLTNLRIDPLLKPLRTDPRWPAILKRVNMQ